MNVENFRYIKDIKDFFLYVLVGGPRHPLKRMPDVKKFSSLLYIYNFF